MSSMASPDISFSVQGHLALITLNRERSMNAVTLDMITRIDAALDQWAMDDQVRAVAIISSSSKFFSAGGDIKAIYDARLDPEPFYDYFRAEYCLNAKIHSFPKPYIAFINGIVMGGGAGVSINGAYRIMGPNAKYAMPEVSIGFFPDAGGTYHLSRMPGCLGFFCALTGTRLAAVDSVLSGVGTHFYPSDDFEPITAQLREGNDISHILATLDPPPAPTTLTTERLFEIDELFGGETLQEVFERLTAANSDFARDSIKTLSQNCPISLEIAFRQVKTGRALNFKECMELEYRILSRILKSSDFYEGIRAAVIEKDRNPQWSVSKLSNLSPLDIDPYFAPLGSGNELFDC